MKKVVATVAASLALAACSSSAPSDGEFMVSEAVKDFTQCEILGSRQLSSSDSQNNELLKQQAMDLGGNAVHLSPLEMDEQFVVAQFYDCQQA